MSYFRRFVVVFSYIFFTRSVATNDRKRILLNDPDLINTKLLNLEKSINELKTENSDLKQQNQNLGQRIQHVETENGNFGQKIQTLETDNNKLGLRIQTIETENNRLIQLINTDSNSHGATYIRWGRKDCPSLNGTTLVYSGIAGGGNHNEKGSGANRLCLPHNPDSLSTIPVNVEGSGAVAKVYGTEYQFSYKNVVYEDDAPCAVCRVMAATSSLMIPAKSSCPTGWLTQYSGILVGNAYSFASASEFVCLDGDPQIFEGRRANTNGNLFYPAVSVCGTLPCPYYGNLKNLPCVLCTK